jgi:hypothetical protein
MCQAWNFLLGEALYCFSNFITCCRSNVLLIYNGIYSVIKKNEILSFLGQWMGLENIILSAVSQVQKAKATCSLLCGI